MDLWLLVALGTFIILVISRWAQRRDAARKGIIGNHTSSGGDFNAADFSWSPGNHSSHHSGASGDFSGGHHGGASGDFGGDSGGGDSGGGHH